MSAENLISTMEKLLKLHQSLLELSTKKTGIVKNNDMDALNQIIKDEQAHLAAIQKFEKERQKFVQSILPGVDQPTISNCLEVVNAADFEKLSRLRVLLLEIVSQIKERNELNQQMIYQSLKFVNLSLNLIVPQQKNFNYEPPSEKKNMSAHSTGLFSSRA
jgi:hypothetical protein